MTKKFFFLLMTSAIYLVSMPTNAQMAEASNTVSQAGAGASKAISTSETVAGQALSYEATSSVGRGLQAATNYAAQGVQTASPHIGNVTSALGGINSITGAGNEMLNNSLTLGNVAGQTQQINSALGGVQQISGVADSYLGTTTGGTFGSVAGQASQYGNAVSSAATSLSNVSKLSDISIGSVGDLKSAITTINQAGSGLTSIGSQLDGYLGTSMTESITGALSGTGGGIIETGSSALGQVSGAYGQISGLASQVSGALELMQNPQALGAMALGLINYENLTKLALNAAEDVVIDYLSSPNVGIPVKESNLKAASVAEKAAKEESAELDNQIADEKQQQIEAAGGKPATDSGAQLNGGQENPAVDNCQAQMATYPRQTNKAFDFVKVNLLDNLSKDKLGPPQSSLEGAVSFVEKTFYFHEDKKDMPTLSEVIQNREKYTKELVSNVLTLGIGIQQNLVEDAASISLAVTSGCNQLQDIYVNSHIMISLIKQTMADIALQARLLELEAMEQINNTQIELREKPQENVSEDALTEVVNKASNAVQSLTGTTAN